MLKDDDDENLDVARYRASLQDVLRNARSDAERVQALSADARLLHQQIRDHWARFKGEKPRKHDP
jgi:hypothetical protein